MRRRIIHRAHRIDLILIPRIDQIHQRHEHIALVRLSRLWVHHEQLHEAAPLHRQRPPKVVEDEEAGWVDAGHALIEAMAEDGEALLHVVPARLGVEVRLGAFEKVELGGGPVDGCVEFLREDVKIRTPGIPLASALASASAADLHKRTCQVESARLFS